MNKRSLVPSQYTQEEIDKYFPDHSYSKLVNKRVLWYFEWEKAGRIIDLRGPDRDEKIKKLKRFVRKHNISKTDQVFSSNGWAFRDDEVFFAVKLYLV